MRIVRFIKFFSIFLTYLCSLLQISKVDDKSEVQPSTVDLTLTLKAMHQVFEKITKRFEEIGSQLRQHGAALRAFRRSKLVENVMGLEMIMQDITGEIIDVDMSLWMSMR